MARIELDSGDENGDLEEALRQLERQQKPSPKEQEVEEPEVARRRVQRERRTEHKRARGDLQGAVEAIRQRKEAEQQAAARLRAPKRWPWVLLGVVVLGVLVMAALALKPEPLPPPVTSAQLAVRGFWDNIAKGHFQGATVYYPSLVQKYGSRKQAAVFLEQHFGEDPPTAVKVGEPEQLPDSADLRITYEVWRRSGRPYTGEFIVRDSGSPETGFIIVTGM